MNQKPKTINQKLIITIDGPAASGKGTVAYALSREYGLLNLDSGACYRAIAWLALENDIKIDEHHIPDLLALLEANPLQLIPNQEPTGPKCYVKVGKKDITHLIRTSEVGDASSLVGEMQEVRAVVRDHEHRIANDSDVGIVVEGRDSGTVVFPGADIKFFLTASPEERARRRFEEYEVAGVEATYEQVLQEILDRDARDTSRAYSALRIPVDAIVVDSTEYEIKQTVEVFKDHVDKYLEEKRLASGAGSR